MKVPQLLLMERVFPGLYDAIEGSFHGSMGNLVPRKKEVDGAFWFLLGKQEVYFQPTRCVLDQTGEINRTLINSFTKKYAKLRQGRPRAVPPAVCDEAWNQLRVDASGAAR
ncbi:MAG: hypothetical protein A2675_03500 [Candidatus Yonathbacteria bacterium RIFCSPHIGHO2_01_FULL_51_10]|uniref:Uncharacterized protein n=1 Tax=Candidatus Yonathbacteria bacterium RIFCSPHIGHO2_01_FULL_51_10 TaxID=1802723 RepID=A0A1G2S8V1_9BACT|nr:MAG: hypothetical protein A2675_03500 [Candidatus Yonathbacteria bacterium RIFCSPHIGHO2_01_FULL_51_10]